MKALMLSSKQYLDSEKHDFGDCFICDTGTDVVVFDCGSEEHATKVINYLKDFYGNNKKAIVVLSHNDSDHYDGIPKLIKENKVEKIYTILLLKYYEELLEKIDDDRKTKDSIKRQILEIYSNIAELGQKGLLENIYNADDSFIQICNGINVIGPTKEYVIEAAGQALDSRQGDKIDKETTVNAASVQLSIEFGTCKMLLVGDASMKAIENNVNDHQIIQIPHHGRLDHAEELFNMKRNDKDTVFLISDNKGKCSGGSEELIKKGKDKGHVVYNTRTEDTKEITKSIYQKSCRVGSYI